jgi:adenine-specific DNA-methyltransferase
MASTVLTWPQKGLVPLAHVDGYRLVSGDHPDANRTHTIAVTREHGPDPSQGLLLRGDSRDALRAFRTDPDWAVWRGEGAALIYLDPPYNTGRRFDAYPDALNEGIWLSMMATRLEEARDALADHGTLWVHLDEAQVHHTRCLLDELFGSDCYLRTVVWQRKNKPGPSRSIAAVCDFILVYGKQPGATLNRLAPSSRQLARYTNPDHDPNGPWIRKHDGVRRYRDEFMQAGAVPTSLWARDEVGDNAEATRELVNLFTTKRFDTPKPERLLARIIGMASKPGDLVIDAFAGSGTTAAVAAKMWRRWLTIERSADTIKTCTLPRLTAVVDGHDQGGISSTVDWAGGGGFQVGVTRIPKQTGTSR